MWDTATDGDTKRGTGILLYRSEHGISIALNHNCPPAGATARGDFALTLLPFLLPPPIFKEGRKTIHTTVHESLRAFIDVKPVSILPGKLNINS